MNAANLRGPRGRDADPGSGPAAGGTSPPSLGRCSAVDRSHPASTEVGRTTRDNCGEVRRQIGTDVWASEPAAEFPIGPSPGRPDFREPGERKSRRPPSPGFIGRGCSSSDPLDTNVTCAAPAASRHGDCAQPLQPPRRASRRRPNPRPLPLREGEQKRSGAMSMTPSGACESSRSCTSSQEPRGHGSGSRRNLFPCPPFRIACDRGSDLLDANVTCAAPPASRHAGCAQPLQPPRRDPHRRPNPRPLPFREGEQKGAWAMSMKPSGACESSRSCTYSQEPRGQGSGSRRNAFRCSPLEIGCDRASAFLDAYVKCAAPSAPRHGDCAQPLQPPRRDSRRRPYPRLLPLREGEQAVAMD
jgi:hypothetical protein